MTTGPVVVATDLTDDAVPAIVRGVGHAAAVGASVVVCHVIPDVVRYHPLLPRRAENELVLEASLTKQAADLVTEQVGRVARIGADAYRIVIESGAADEEIVRLAESEQASLVVVGAKPRHGTERLLGHVAERVVRYAHTSVLVARPGHETGKVLVPTDFAERATPALELTQRIARSMPIRSILLHVLELPQVAFTSALSPVGLSAPVPQYTVTELEKLGQTTLAGLAQQYGFTDQEQVIGEAGRTIVERAEALDVEMIVMGSRGRTGFSRLLLGSIAEKVIRATNRSVLVVRAGRPVA